jgi:GTPase SAR1 family protein
VEGTYRDNRGATIGAFFLTKRLTLEKSALCCKLLLWDTSGQEQFQRLALTYYKKAAAAIVCVDLSSPDVEGSLAGLRFWLDQVRTNIVDHRIVIVVAGCKSDLVLAGSHAEHHHHNQQHRPGAPNGPSSTTLLEEHVRAEAERFGALYVRTSAKTNQGVSQAFQKTASLVLQCQQDYGAGRGRPIPVTLGGGASSAHGTTASGVSIRNPSRSKHHHRSLSPTIHSPHHPHDDPKKQDSMGYAGTMNPSHPSSYHRRALSAGDPSSNNPRYSRPHSSRENHHPSTLPENRHDRASTALTGAGHHHHRDAASSALSPTFDKTTGGVVNSEASYHDHHAAGLENNHGYDSTHNDDDNEHDRSGDGLLGQGSRIMCDNGLLLCAGSTAAAASGPSSSSSVDEGQYGGGRGTSASSQECAIL